MPPALLDEVREWLARARTDLRAAHMLVSGASPALSVACFLCQQAAEKSLKAFLAWEQTAFRKTHVIEELVRTCAALDASFTSLLPAGAVLTPYATEFRYPGGRAEPTGTEADEAIRLAEQTLDFVLARLPEELRR
jgi:HEPN domain-containing protein